MYQYIPAIAQGLFGLGQSIFSGRKRAERELKKLANSYKPNQGIMDYYNKALSRYSANPYESLSYKQRENIIGRNLATGIGASQDRRSGLATVTGLVQGANDAGARASAEAEQQQAQALGQLGQAAQVKAAEERRPFEMKYNLLAQKAGQAATRQNMGIQNIFGALGTASVLMGGKGKKTQPQNVYGANGTYSTSMAEPYLSEYDSGDQ